MTPIPSSTARALERIQFGSLALALCAGSFSVAIGQIGLGLTLLAALVRWAVFRVRPPATGMERVTLLFVGWALLMIPLSTDAAQSLVFSKRFFLLSGLWLGAAVVAQHPARRRALLTALVAGAAGISLFGIVVALRTRGGLFDDRLDQVNNAMTSGAVLMLTVLLGAGVLLTRGLSARARRLLAAGLAPVALALLMTMTRSAVLGLLVGGAVMLLLARPRLFAVYAGTTAVVLVVLFVFGSRFLPARLATRVDPAFYVSGFNTTTRVDMWRVGWRMVAAHPVTGVGDRDLTDLNARYKGDIDVVPFGHLHSNPLHLAVIWGVPGFVLAMAFLLRQAQLLWRQWRRAGGRAATDDPWAQGWRLGALGLWCGFFVAGLTEWYFGDAEPMLLYCALIGVALGAPPTAEPASPAKNPTGGTDA
jgi:O-antigen ligase